MAILWLEAFRNNNLQRNLQMADREENKILLWMFKNDKQNDRQPDYTGPGRISKDVLKEIVEAYKKYVDGDSL